MRSKTHLLALTALFAALTAIGAFLRSLLVEVKNCNLAALLGKSLGKSGAKYSAAAGNNRYSAL